MKRAAVVVTTILAAALVLPVGSAHAGTLTVRTTDAATGAALANVLVVVAEGNSVLAVGRTSAGGAFTCSVTTAGATVIAARDLYVTDTRPLTIGAQGEQSIAFALRKHQPEDFNRLGRIVGFVRSGTGTPIPNATLVLLREGTPVGAAQPKNPTGVYELQWYRPGTYSVMATAPRHAAARHTGQTMSAGESLWLDITLQAN